MSSIFEAIASSGRPQLAAGFFIIQYGIVLQFLTKRDTIGAYHSCLML